MKKYDIIPEKVRGLGNVMSTNSDVRDMTGVRCTVNSLNTLTDYSGNKWPLFQMGITGEEYNTSVSLTLNKNTANVGESITITGLLLDYQENPIEGAIAFFCDNDCITDGVEYGSQVVYAITDNYGVVSFNYALDSVGDYSFSAISVGSNTYRSGRSNVETVTVSKAIVTAHIAVSNDIVEGDDVTVTVCLKKQDNTVVTGLSYDFFLDDELFEVVTNNSSGDNFVISDLEAGTHNVKVNINGDDYYESNSVSSDFVVGDPIELVPTQILANDVPITSVPYGEAVGLGFEVFYYNPNDEITILTNGSVSLYDSSNNLIDTQLINEGNVSFTISPPVGTNVYYAVFEGTDNYAKSTSNNVTVSVNPNTTITLSDLNPQFTDEEVGPALYVVGEETLCTATLKSGNIPLVGEEVHLFFAGQEDSSITNNQGVATFNSPIMSDIVTENIHCYFEGNENYSACEYIKNDTVSGVFRTWVDWEIPEILAIGEEFNTPLYIKQITPGGDYTINEGSVFMMIDGQPYGTLYLGNNGVNEDISFDTPGVHTISVEYEGKATVLPVTETFDIVVRARPNINLTSDKHNFAPGENCTLTATVTDYNNNPLSDMEVTFYNFVLIGGMRYGYDPIGSAVTDSEGVATYTLETTENDEFTFKCVAGTPNVDSWQQGYSEIILITCNSNVLNFAVNGDPTLPTLYCNGGDTLTLSILYQSNDMPLINTGFWINENSNMVLLNTGENGIAYYQFDATTEGINKVTLMDSRVNPTIEKSFDIVVNKITPTLQLVPVPAKAEDLEEVVLTATLLDENEFPISGGTIILYEYGSSLHPNAITNRYNLSTDSDGVATYTIEAEMHARQVYSCEYIGDSRYNSVSTEKINVLIKETPTVDASFNITQMHSGMYVRGDLIVNITHANKPLEGIETRIYADQQTLVGTMFTNANGYATSSNIIIDWGEGLRIVTSATEDYSSTSTNYTPPMY